jgi:ABC-2 type transport system permease protein
VLRLLKIEAGKILYYKAFWAIVVISALAFYSVGKLSNITVNGAHLSQGVTALFWASAFVCQIFFGCLLILLICNEYENRTLRQHIIDGMSRAEIFLSLFLVQLILILSSVLLVLLVGFATGHIENFGELLSSDTLITIGQYILRSLGFFSLALLISLFVKKSGLAVALFLCWPFFLEPALGWIVEKYVGGVSDLLPTAVFSHLLKSPLSGAVMQNAASSENSGGAAGLLIAIGYTLFFWSVGLIRLFRSDV